jgi:hypothetical protein
MKQFDLTVGKRSYRVIGNSLEEVEGWENGIPKIWADNRSKIKEKDITEEKRKDKEKEDAGRTIGSIDSKKVTPENLLKVVSALVDLAKGDARELVKTIGNKQKPGDVPEEIKERSKKKTKKKK